MKDCCGAGDLSNIAKILQLARNKAWSYSFMAFFKIAVSDDEEVIIVNQLTIFSLL